MLPDIRIGTGFDVHAFQDGASVILGGILIPYHRSLKGHSDADVVSHALMDALLGAASLGDIGSLFPDTDEEYRGADSIELLKEVCSLLRRDAWEIVNCDIIIMAQEPRIAPWRDAMQKNIAGAMAVDESRVSVKATTTEKLGFTGRGEGIAVQAVALLAKVN